MGCNGDKSWIDKKGGNSMITERTYNPSELHHGVCSYCGDESDEITEEGICVDCVEAEKFYQETMEGL